MPTVKATPEQIEEIEARLKAGLPPFPDMRLTQAAAAVPKMTEEDFLQEIIALAHAYRWRASHFRPGLTKGGKWVTPVQADGAGFPDLVLVRERVVWVEAKSETGILSAAQKAWSEWLKAAKQEWYCWYPNDWPTIQEVLK